MDPMSFIAGTLVGIILGGLTSLIIIAFATWLAYERTH